MVHLEQHNSNLLAKLQPLMTFKTLLVGTLYASGYFIQLDMRNQYTKSTSTCP